MEQSDKTDVRWGQDLKKNMLAPEVNLAMNVSTMRGVVAQRLVRCLASGRSQVRIPLQLPRRDLGQVLHSQLPVALRSVNSNTVSMLWSGAPLSGSELEEALQK